MRIKVNGETHELPPALSVAGLVGHLRLDLKQVAVERNREIVPRSLYGEVALRDGDEIEIVQFIGGG